MRQNAQIERVGIVRDLLTDSPRAVGTRVKRGPIMTLPAYDIMKKEDNNFVWVEAAHDIQSAKKRISELSRHSDAEFVIFDEHTLQVVATFETPISF
jgi:hypothetical protein